MTNQTEHQTAWLAAAVDKARRLNQPMVERLRRCAADTRPDWAGAVTVYPPETRGLVALIDLLLNETGARPAGRGGGVTGIAIKLIHVAGGGRPTPFDGQWLVEYDPTRPGTGPNGQPMSAHIVCSPNLADAHRFPDTAAAHACWTAQSGKPWPKNAPLTAYTVAFEPVEEASWI